MKKVFVYLFSLVIFYSCGILIDTEEETFTYTYILKNETGITLFVSLEGVTNELSNGEVLECSYHSPFSVGLCQQFLKIRFSDNTGYKCYGAISDSEGLCFTDETLIFGNTDKEPSIFTEISTRTYEYVFTQDLLDGAFELPE